MRTSDHEVLCACTNSCALEAEIERLRAPYRNVDDLDWSHLMGFIPDSGHGRFWKSVFAELRTALADEQKAPEMTDEQAARYHGDVDGDGQL